MLEDLDSISWTSMPHDPEAPVRERIARIKGRSGGEKTVRLRQALQEIMMAHCSVFRHEETLVQALSEIEALKEGYARVGIDNRGACFNTDLLEALELEHLLGLGEAMVASALARKESRGAHSREDFPERDDDKWLRHTLIHRQDLGYRVFDKPVTITRFQPKPRAY
jgi:succinate dehydrogenase / fumarate reductase flavoprotein subunit